VIAFLIALAGVALLRADLVQAVPDRGAAVCAVEPSSIVSRSPAGQAQVSNLAFLQMRASIPPRRMPASGTLQGLQAQATVYQIKPDGTRTIVASSVNSTGGGGDTQAEYIAFILDIPIDVAERDAAIRDYIAEVARAAAASTNERERAMAATLQANGAAAFVPLFRQHRAGRFHVECRVIDNGQQVASGASELEVLFTGRFFDQPSFRVK
jgi:hypothetical protein